MAPSKTKKPNCKTFTSLRDNLSPLFDVFSRYSHEIVWSYADQDGWKHAVAPIRGIRRSFLQADSTYLYEYQSAIMFDGINANEGLRAGQDTLPMIPLLAWKKMAFVNITNVVTSMGNELRAKLSDELKDGMRWCRLLELNIEGSGLTDWRIIKNNASNAYLKGVTYHTEFSERCYECEKTPLFADCLRGGPGGACLNCSHYSNGMFCDYRINENENQGFVAGVSKPQTVGMSDNATSRLRTRTRGEAEVLSLPPLRGPKRIKAQAPL